MNILGFLSAHQAGIYALLVAAFAVTTAKKIIPKMTHKERGPHARWASFIIYVLGGFALAVAMVPLIRWLIGLASHSGFGSLVGNVTAVASLALGWHAIAMIVSVVRDLADKTPDHEARTGALWIPTFLPIGIAAVLKLVSNPDSVGRGLAAAAMGVITLIYASMIAKRADAAGREHKTKWNWFVFGIYVLAGLVIIPMFSYANSALISLLPSAIANLIRVVLGLSGIGLIIAGIADIWVDRVPDAYARSGARFGIGLISVFGGLALSIIGGAIAAGAGSIF